MSPIRIGILSDTHGLLRPEIIRELNGCNHIIHAGDVGKAAILDELRKIAPLTVVRGNVDHEDWADVLPLTATVVVEQNVFFVIHDLAELEGNPSGGGYRSVVSGHTHRFSQGSKNGILYLNPGSAGPHRFGLPATMMRLTVAGERLEIEKINID